MCGITGYINLKNDVSQSLIDQMTDTLIHRGPDDKGSFISEDKHIAFGHRRLSFLDLSEHGKQPMKNNLGNIVITFNGEIYNFLELRDQLAENYQFKTNTDTEVILAGYQKWGIDVVNKLKGMFAFALFDKDNHRLFLVRDRFGIKPLYYSIQDCKLLFASELKAIHSIGVINREVDFSSFVDYFVYRYIPSPKTIWKDIQKISPAHFASIDTISLDIQLTEYWQLKSGNNCDYNSVNKVNTILRESVKKQIYADVPIGSFLSGGYDSSALVYYMNLFNQKPNTFSIGFNNWGKSEDQFAKIVAKYLHVPNESVIVDEKSLDLIEIMPTVYDEPIADISIIPTYIVSELAHSKVKAVLSGEGADEIFGGYSWQHDFFDKSYPVNFFEKIKQKLVPIDTVAYYAKAMAMGGFDERELKKMLHADLHQFIPSDLNWFYRKHFNSNLSPLKSVQYMDIKCFMGELVLTKIDRASMANSLEVRVPFLDHELFEYVFKLDEKEYFKKNQTKYLLYKNIENYLPKIILDRNKQGFVGPDSYYMNIGWYKNQLKNCKLVELKIINQQYIDDLLNEKYTWKLWKILIMEKWFARWVVK